MNKLKAFKLLIAFIGVTWLVKITASSEQLLQVGWWEVLLFVSLAVLIERIHIPLPQGHVSFSLVFILWAFSVFGHVIFALWAVLIGIFINQALLIGRKLGDVFFNIGMMTITILTSNHVFHFLGGNWGGLILENTVPMLGMLLVMFILNHACLYVLYKLMNPTYSVVDIVKDSRWDLVTYLITVPLGILMAYLHSELHLIGGLLLFIPIVISSYIFRLYKKLDNIYARMKGLYTVAAEINGNLDVNKTLNSIGDVCLRILELDSFYIFLARNNNELTAVYSRGEMDEYLKTEDVKLGQGITGKVAQSKKSIIVRDTSKDKRVFTIPGREKGAMMSVPLIRGGKAIGVMTAVKYQPFSLNDQDLQILEIIASQSAVALDNAKLYEQMQNLSQVDELTNTYNYRYFQKRLELEVQNSKDSKQPVSLMVIDLDNFKRINDTYGHEVGNKVLSELADILKGLIRQKDVLARYGGDEFVIIFSKTAKDVAEKVALRILATLTKHNFKCGDSYEKITFSAGIADFPNDAEDSLDLMRKADRIMYTGSKEKGKSKVAVFNK
ncbi:sensor domain-containing diguanylate cyclase [Proteinivorax hydrogeniformans]|uniref:Sensor domain-containing diguanylate cyclase n=1 Tax=Proteinivorax hydrogeniformans TaxID=1826727 RepID=A0AAU8HUX0_9FIRM